MYVFFLRIRRPPRSTRTDTLFPYTTLFRSDIICAGATVVAARSGAGMAEDRDRRNLPPLNLHVPEPKFRPGDDVDFSRSEEHTSELQSLMRISYAVFCLKKKHKHKYINKILDTDTVHIDETMLTNKHI